MYKEHKREIAGFDAHTTNNRMELTAAIEAINALSEACSVELYTDSAYLVNAFERGWLIGWQSNGWRNSKKDAVENQDLWKLLLNVSAGHRITYVKVKGHSDNEYNNRCDALARGQITQHKKAEEQDKAAASE